MLAREQIHQALAGTGPAVLISSSAKFDPESESFKSLLSEMTTGAEQIAILIETSGSSGTPKLVALSAQAINSSAKVTNQFLGAEIGDRWSLTLPLNHIAGINQLTRSINLETTPAPSDGEGAQFISVVPTQLHRAIQNKDSLFKGHEAGLYSKENVRSLLMNLTSSYTAFCIIHKDVNEYLRKIDICLFRRKNIIIGSIKTMGKNLVAIDIPRAIALSSYFFFSKK